MNFLITEFCGLGNSVLLSSLFKSLKQSFQNHITLVGDNKFSGVTANEKNIYIDKSIIFKVKIGVIFNYVKILKKIDIFIIPAHSNPSLIFLIISILFCKCKFLVSENYFKQMNFFKKSFLKKLILIKKLQIIKVPYENNLHEIEINFKYLNHVKTRDFKMPYIERSLYFNYPRDENCLKNFNLEPNSYIVFQPFSANGIITSKNWPLDNFLNLAKILTEEYPQKKIVLVGDTGDKKHFRNIFMNKEIINLISKTNISQLIELLKNSSIIICHDSSILHLSDSMNLKNISLFGQSNLTKNKPNSKNSICIKKNTMQDISVNEVNEKIKTLMNN